MTTEEMDRAIKPIRNEFAVASAHFDALIAELENNPELQEKAKRDSEAFMADQMEIGIESAYRNTVPERYADMKKTLNTSGNESRGKFYKKVLDTWEEMKKGEYATLMLFGESGIGKTYLACWIIFDALHTKKRERFGLQENWIPVYVTGEKLAQRYKAAESFSAKETKDRIAWQYIKPDLLVIDEIGRNDSPYEKDAIFNIIDGRKGNTILISNMNLETFKDYVGPAITDRLNPTAVCPSTAGMESWRTR